MSGYVRDTIEGEVSDYYSLGKYTVADPGVCGERPTFKYPRIEVEVVLDLFATGALLDRVVENFCGRAPREASEETLHLSAPVYSAVRWQSGGVE